uniref:PEP-CTERM sorting domain-containing protein n=1 Tax=Desulfobacca acetoxidans TaxID=60893 RepID=A0A7V4G964_9BACT
MRKVLMRLRAITFLALMAAGLLFTPAPADSITLGFYNITPNDGTGINAAISRAQLFVEVFSYDRYFGLAEHQVAFHFFNTGPAPSVITDIYFDTGILSEIAWIHNGPGVAFSPGAQPAKLPWGNYLTPGFQSDKKLSADSDASVIRNGVSPGEYVDIIVNLKPGKTYGDVLKALALTDLSLDNRLRLGIHVQGFAAGSSESLVNYPHTVPVPGSLLLLGTGVAGLLLATGRRRARRK